MRIALLSDTYTPQVNGVTTVVRRIAALLRAGGHEVVVVAPRYPQGPETKDEQELRVASVPFPLYSDIRLSLPSFRRVAEFLNAFRPSLIHVHTEGGIGLAGRRYALGRGVPLVTSFHTNFPQYSRHYGVGLLEPAVWRWLVWFHRAARLTLTPGHAVRDELARRGLTGVAVWGCGVDTKQFHPGRRNTGWRRWLAGGDNTAVVLHVGRLAREKNLDVLIEVWDRARTLLGQRATFVVAGAGPYARRIQSRLPFVRQLGFLPREELASLYASADLCVLPSHTETCGLVALEAMAAGVPVIAADAGGLRESVAHGVTGLLVPPHDVEGFVGALAGLAADPARRFSFAAAGREAALTHDVAREDAALLGWYATLAGQPDHGAAPRAA